MIEVKGTKPEAQTAVPAERYVLKNGDRMSKTPAILSVLLMSVALYLKSVFPTWTKVANEKSTAETEPETIETAALDTSTPDDMPTSTVAQTDEPVDLEGAPTDSLPPEGFAFVDSPYLGHFQADVSLDWSKFNDRSGWYEIRTPLLGARAANDNSGGGTASRDYPSLAAGVPVESVSGLPGQSDDHQADNDPGNSSGDPSDTDEGGADPGGCEAPDEGICDEDDDPQSGNRAPRTTGPVYLMDVAGCAIVGIGLADLLRHAIDPDGDVLTVENLNVSSGTLTQTGNGWIYQGGSQSLGPVTVTYVISDGELSVAQTAHFSVIARSIEGTDGDDILLGTRCADDIDGGDGSDNIDSGLGDDAVVGGAGDDHIVAGAGSDTVLGGAGDDIVFGGAGNDHISGGAGNDRLFGEAGNDIIFGDAGDDYLSGGDGSDVLRGGMGHDIVEGGAGDDTIDGGDGDDELHGGAGNDVLIDGAGNDIVSGGDGDDYLIASADGDNDVFDGGDGCDMLDYSGTSEGVRIDLVSGTACGLEIGEDAISGFETVKGGAGDDHFVAAETPMVFIGGGGENTFEFQDSASSSASDLVMHEILDFKVGDRVRMSKYDIFEKVFDDLDDRFEDVYGEDVDDDEIAIRYRNDHTVIEADFDNDDIYETTITLFGNHVLVIVEHA